MQWSGQFEPGVEAAALVGVVAGAGGEGLDKDDAVAVVAEFDAVAASRQGPAACVDHLAAQAVTAVEQREA